VVNAAQTETILFGKDGVAETLPKDAVFVSSATMDPEVARRLAKQLEATAGTTSTRRSAAAPSAPRRATHHSGFRQQQGLCQGATRA